MKIAVIQMTSSDDPSQNTATVLAAMDRAGPCDLIVTPEVTNCLSTSAPHLAHVLRHEHDDPLLSAVAKKAARIKVPVLLGSLALKTQGERYANRSILIGADGHVIARYDKAHMFDVTLNEQETYRESARYRPGDALVTARIGDATLGLTICYDVRFPHVYRRLAQAGAQILTVPSAFSPVTGAAHWEVLLRARAIETGCFVVAPAQTGLHKTTSGGPSRNARSSYGHSMVVSPWGEVLLHAGNEPCIHVVNLDMNEVELARKKVPSVFNDRDLAGPS